MELELRQLTDFVKGPDGITTRLDEFDERFRSLEEDKTSTDEKLSGLEDLINQLQDDKFVLQGLISRREQQIEAVEDRIAFLQAKSWPGNFLSMDYWMMGLIPRLNVSTSV